MDMTDEDVTLHSYIKWSSQQKQKPNLASALHNVKGHVIRTAMVHKNESDVSDLATETTPLASRYAQDRRDVIEHVVGTALVHADDCKSAVDVTGDVLENRLNYELAKLIGHESTAMTSETIRPKLQLRSTMMSLMTSSELLSCAGTIMTPEKILLKFPIQRGWKMTS